MLGWLRCTEELRLLLGWLRWIELLLLAGWLRCIELLLAGWLRCTELLLAGWLRCTVELLAGCVRVTLLPRCTFVDTFDLVRVGVEAVRSVPCRLETVPVL